MVMSDRPEVRTAPWPIAVIDTAGLAAGLLAGLGLLPFRGAGRAAWCATSLFRSPAS